jgi:hypothetical protein
MIADRWGVTAEEVAAAYPCDDHVTRPTVRAWRGVAVRAPIEVVWSWLIQIRLAPYSYDWIDNRGRRSPRTLQHLDDPVVGDPFTSSAGHSVGRVLAVAHAEHLTGRIGSVAMTYRVRATGSVETRLVLKLVGSVPRPLAPALSMGDLVMARRQLLTFKELAEAQAAGRRVE